MAIKLKKKRRQKASVPERWNLKKHGVSSSFIASWLQCKEKAKLAYIDGYERMTGNKKAMRFGDFFHKCLEIHNGKNAKDTVKKVLKQWQKGSEGFRAGDQLHQAYEEAAGKAEALLVAYQDFWKKDDSKRKWIAREQYFRQSYCGVDLCGLRDGVFLDKSKGIWLLETKTAARIDIKMKTELLAMDIQTMMYLISLALQFPAKKHLIRGVVYNVVRKPQLKQRLNPTKTKPVPEELHEYLKRCTDDINDRPEFYFNRIENACGIEQALQWGQEVLKPVLEEVKQWAEGKSAHYKNPISCQDKYGLCDFFAVCARNETKGLRVKKRPFEHHPIERE